MKLHVQLKDLTLLLKFVLMLTSHDLAFFATIARAPTLAAAARQLDVTASAVTQRLQELERRLGVRLVHRSGRRIALTDEGTLLADRGAPIAQSLAALADEVQARQGIVAGRLRVLAPMGFGRTHVAGLVHQFAARHPTISVDLDLTDRLGGIPTSAWDVAIHIGALRDSSLIGIRLAPNARILCAAPELVERHGLPVTPADLRGIPCLAIRENEEDTTLWRFQCSTGQVTVRVEPVRASNDGEVVRQWALAGAGVMVRSEWSVAGDLAAGRLVRLLPDCTLPSADIMALTPSRTGGSARSAHFVAFLREAFAAVRWETR